MEGCVLSSLLVNGIFPGSKIPSLTCASDLQLFDPAYRTAEPDDVAVKALQLNADEVIQKVT